MITKFFRVAMIIWGLCTINFSNPSLIFSQPTSPNDSMDIYYRIVSRGDCKGPMPLGGKFSKQCYALTTKNTVTIVWASRYNIRL